MLKVLFIANLEHLRISSPLGRGEKIGENYFITNDHDLVTGLITPIFRNLAGDIEVYHLRISDAVAYSIEDHQPFSDDREAISFLNANLSHLQLFLQYLWLVKDNSVNIELGYLEYPFKASLSKVSRNTCAFVFSTSEGSVKETEFTKEEFRHACHLSRHYMGEIVGGSYVATDETPGRFERAMYFLRAARCSTDLGVKIANYCTCMECLFSTDAQGLSHKLAERIACFLEKHLSERIKIFQTIKKAYDIRSKVVHGSRSSPKSLEETKRTSESCDLIIRRIFKTILKESSLHSIYMKPGGDKDIEEFFLSLVLGPSSLQR